MCAWRIVLPRWRRMYWIPFLLVGYVCLGIQMQKVLADYFRYPVKTLILIEDGSMPPFPYITICNNNMIRKSALMRPECYVRVCAQYPHSPRTLHDF